MALDMNSLLPQKKNTTICAVYTHYEKDHTKSYDTILGHIVPDLNSIPEGMVGIKIKKANYCKFIAKGDLTKNAVIDKWQEIWNMDLDRTYTADYELYDERALNPANGEVDIFIAVQ